MRLGIMRKRNRSINKRSNSRKMLGSKHPYIAKNYWNLGVLYDQQGQYQKAKSLYLPALEIYQRCLGQNHPTTKNFQNWLNALPKGREALPLEDLGL